MRVAKFLVGVLSMLICVLFIAAIAGYYAGEFDFMLDARDVSVLGNIVFDAALLVPLLFLASFVEKRLRAPWLWPLTMILAASFAAVTGSEAVYEAGIDLRAIASRDAIGLKRLAVSILDSPKVYLASYFTRALGWLGLCAALRPVDAADRSIRHFRAFCALTGLAYASVIGYPLAAVFMPLAYWSLGTFLIGTRLGFEDKRKLKFTDDYHPA
ncbi:MAG: hypothetical protein CVV47_12825 [Spirochaetae bacterium HGW-Spirochaetae-3]|jgi:hypothetical protein|nr:MAG: hypothetical protein CVV47_12825 [Spirochaetae bacterium HGW-Spirochaetae-3]